MDAFSLPQVCKILAIDVSTLYRWLVRAQIQAIVAENDKRKKYLTLAQVQKLAQNHGLQLSRKTMVERLQEQRKSTAPNATELNETFERVALLETRIGSLETLMKALQNTLQKQGNSLAALAELQAKMSGLEVQIEAMKVQPVATLISAKIATPTSLKFVFTS